jgi:subtilisin family serine protease
VSIHVVDTGLLADAASHRWLAGVTGEEEKLPAGADGTVEIPPYAGHGTFVAGVARCFAPDAAVHVTNVLSLAGAALETEIVRHLDTALGLGPDIISLSAGGTSRGDRPLLGFEMFWERYRQHKGTVLVAAAGNNSGRRPFWPAALPGVVSVGALSADLRSRAYFSGYGPWVDVYAPGERLINAYARGSYWYHEPPRTGERREFWGMAAWSGTSFATPVVAGLIAARMSRTGENGRRAADAVLAAARAEAVPGVGPVAGTGGFGLGGWRAEE